MDRIALEQQCVGLGIGQIVDRDQFKPAIGTFQDGPGDKAANAPEAVDCNFHRSEEHTSELQSLMRTSYAAFRLKKKKSTSRRSSANTYQPQILLINTYQSYCLKQ